MRKATLLAALLAPCLAARVRAAAVEAVPEAGFPASPAAGAAGAAAVLPAPALSAPGLLSAPSAPAPGPALSALVSAHAARPLSGVALAQEQEGSLIAADPRDSSGDVFRYYRPVELRPGLAARVSADLRGLDRLVFGARRLLRGGRMSPEAEWRAWPRSAKLAYLHALELAVSAERGPGAAWDGKVSLLLARVPGAPGFVQEHPHMEPPPDGLAGATGARFLQPEIVSAKDRPAKSVEEALARTRRVIADTGHAGTQYHAFVKADPAVLRAQAESLDGALQLVNDALFARAARGGAANLSHPSLRPWHAGRAARVRRLLDEAPPEPGRPSADDADSEKHAFVGLRWWGLEDGKAAVSLELRGAGLPFKSASRTVSGVDSGRMPERDYSEARTYLTVLSLYAEALARGEAPAVPVRPVVLDAPAADALLSARAAALGLPAGAFDGLAALARRLAGADALPQGWLFPFSAAPAAPETRALADSLAGLGARAHAAEAAGRAGDLAHLRYLAWNAYADWAAVFGARREAQLADLARASAR
jgi:hypothetical protein